jgi:hypothetical protein
MWGSWAIFSKVLSKTGLPPLFLWDPILTTLIQKKERQSEEQIKMTSMKLKIDVVFFHGFNGFKVSTVGKKHNFL